MLDNEKDYDVIIAGAGAAGLTAAAYLGKYGYSVLLCDKNEKTGGLVSSFEYDGFVFDGGIRAFENSGIIFPMLKQLGIEMEFVKNPVSIGIEKSMIRLISQESILDYENLLNHYFPDDKEDIEKIMQEVKKVMGYMEVIYGIDNPLFLDYTEDKKYLFHTLLPWLVKYQKNIKKAMKLNLPVNEYLLNFTKNQSLIDIITQHFFKNTPTFFALSYFGLYLDYFYPVGGTNILNQKLNQYIQEHGGNILTKGEITTVRADEKRIILRDGRTFSYKKLIWACDTKKLYQILDSDKLSQIAKIEEKRRLVNSHKGGDSILTIFLGTSLEKDYFNNRCGPHCFYTPDTKGLTMAASGWLKKKYEKQELKEHISEYLLSTTYELSCPALRDSTLAPEHNCGLIISTLMDYSLVKKIYEEGWYEEFKDLCIKNVVQVLNDAIFSELKANILFSYCSTPRTIETLTGNSEGAITGWAFTNDKLPSETRLPKIAKSVNTPIPDIYQAGQWSFSPSGLPVSILTGKLAADKIRKELGIKN